jgi:threonine/homoserine efflux transporter RhtA
MTRLPGGVLALGAAAGWGLAAVVAKDTFDALPPLRLSELRAAVAALLLLTLGLVVDRAGLRRCVRHWPAVIALGATLASVNATYYLAIERLPVGVAVTIQYTGPVLVLVLRRRSVGVRLWGSAALALGGAALVSGVASAAPSDVAGVLFAAASAVAFAAYLIVGERLTRATGPFSSVAAGFAAATVLWSIVLPWWTFPFAALGDVEIAAQAGVVAVIGTAVPFLLLLAALRTISAGLGGVLASSEPAFGALFAWSLLGERLGALQLAGMALTTVAVGAAQRVAEPDAPPSAS